MRYNVGDKVLIRNDLKPMTEYDGVYFTVNMSNYAGKVVTIEDICFKDKSYNIEEDEMSYCWTEDMFVKPESMNESQRALMNCYAGFPEQISIVWSVEDVLQLEPSFNMSWKKLGMTRQEAAHVLHKVKKNHDENIGINLEILEFWAIELYGNKYLFCE